MPASCRSTRLGYSRKQMVPAAEMAHHSDLGVEEVQVREAPVAHAVELVVERADAGAGDGPPGPRDRFERAQQQGGVERVPVRAERAGAEDEAVGGAGEKCQG